MTWHPHHDMEEHLFEITVMIVSSSCFFPFFFSFLFPLLLRTIDHQSAEQPTNQPTNQRIICSSSKSKRERLNRSRLLPEYSMLIFFMSFFFSVSLLSFSSMNDHDQSKRWIDGWRMDGYPIHAIKRSSSDSPPLHPTGLNSIQLPSSHKSIHSLVLIR